MSKFLLLLFGLVVLTVKPAFAQIDRSAPLDTQLVQLGDLIFDDPQSASPFIDSLNALPSFLENKIYQHSLGNYYYFTGQYNEAYSAYNRALNLALADNDSSRLLSLNNNIGVILIELGRISEAIAYLREVLERRKPTADTGRILSSYGNLIEAYQVLDNPEQVIELIAEASQIKGDSLRYSEAYRRLHLLAYFNLYRLKNYREALKHLQRMKALNASSQDPRNEAEYHLGMGRIFAAFGDFKSAQEQFDRAINEFEAAAYPGGLSSSYREMGILLQELNPNLAKQYFLKALSIETAPDMRLGLYTNLYEIYKKGGQAALALDAMENRAVLKDSLQGLAVQKAVFDIESKYELKAKENEIRQLNDAAIITELRANQAEDKAQRLNQYLWTGALIALFLVLFFVGQSRNQRLKREQERLQSDLAEQHLQNEKQHLQIQLFRSQINPHFFFNTLNSIQSFVLNNEALQSSRYLGKFARLMRATLELNEFEFISLERELEILGDYLELEKLRFESKFDWNLSLPPDLKEHLIPTMILQPFVENAIVHGFRDLDRGGSLEIKVGEDETGILIEILDNGKGLSLLEPTEKKAKRSMALQLIEERLALLSTEQNRDFSYKLSNRFERDGLTGVLVQIRFPKM